MVGTANAAEGDRLTCEKCQGFYAVEAPEGAKPRLRCNACGNIRELGTPPVPKPEEKGKWTVVGPDGKVMTFGSWEKVGGSARPPALEEKKLSATALLNTTPPLGAPKLMLDDLESNPILPVRPSAKPAPAKSTAPLLSGLGGAVTPSVPPVLTKSAAPKPGTKKPTLELPKADPIADASAPESAEEAAPLSLRDALVDEPETLPLSLRDLIPPDDETSPLSLRDVTTSDTDVSDADSSDAHEVVSVDDVVLLTPGETLVESDQHPPARGALRTLPPTRAKGDVAPPPTITFEEPPTVDSQAITTKVDPKRIASKAPPKKTNEAEPKRSGASAKPSPLSDTQKSPVARAVTSGATAKAAVTPDEPAKRGWIVPAITVAAVAILGWRLMAASPKPAAPEPAPPIVATAMPEPTTTAAPTETAAPVEAPATAETVAAAAATPPPVTDPAPTATPTAQTTTTSNTTTSGSSTSGGASATKTTGATGIAVAAADTADKVDKKAPPAGGESMSDLLDRAGSARRGGDLGTARDLYERVVKQNPGNVEANGGLGDVLRAQGDLGGAKTSYERALAASPTYGPAQLGLADIEWEQGNRGSAQRRYAQIVEQQGRRAPERARQRSAPSE